MQTDLSWSPQVRSLAISIGLALASSQSLASSLGTMIRPQAFKATADRLISNNVVPVISCADDGSAGTLRDAFTNAIDGDTIDLSGLTCSTITLTTGALVDSPAALNVKLLGSGQTIDGADSDRVISHLGTGNLTIQQLTIAHGHHTTAGGCIYSAGSVTLRRSIVSSCHVIASGYYDAAQGGAIFAQGGVDVYDASTISDSSANSEFGKVEGGGVWALDHVRVRASSISGNSAFSPIGYSRGGGVFAYQPNSNLLGYTVAVTRSTISANSATYGGGIFADHVSVLYSTISDNIATLDGGGILAQARAGAFPFSNLCLNGTISGNRSGQNGGGLAIQTGEALVMEYCTITNNHSQKGGGGIFSSGTLGRFNSVIIAGNDSTLVPSGGDLGGTLTAVTGEKNLIVASTIFVPMDTINSPPLLGPLQANGGTTFTHALMPGSPAIDHGGNREFAAYDQRGHGNPRVVGSSADIGAFEFNDHPSPSVACVLPSQIFLAGTTSTDGTTDVVAIDLSKLFLAPTGNSLSYSASGLPIPPLAIDAATGMLTGTLGSGDAGTTTATLTATASPAGTSATQTVRFDMLSAQDHIFRNGFDLQPQPCQ